MKKVKFICKIVIFYLIFLLGLYIRSYWDSYRFYMKGESLLETSMILSVRYYSSSIHSKPIFKRYANKSQERLKELINKELSTPLHLFIEDELSIK